MHFNEARQKTSHKAKSGFNLKPGLPAEASFAEGHVTSGQLVQASPEHLRFRPSSFTRTHLGQIASISFELANQNRGTVRAEIVDISHGRSGSAPEIGLRPLSPSVQEGKDIVQAMERFQANSQILWPSEQPIWCETITDPIRIRRIWEALATRQCRASLQMHDGSVVDVLAAQVDLKQKRVTWKFEGPRPTLPFSLELVGYNSRLVSRFVDAEIGDTSVTTSFPDAVVRVRRRKLRRAPVATPLDLYFSHPIWPDLQVKRPVLDISYDSLSFLTQPGEDILYPGMRLSNLHVELPGQEPVRLNAEVRSISTTPEGRRCGMRVAPASPDYSVRWRRLVERQLHPRAYTAGDWSKECWSLFEKSGYFNLSGKDPVQFEALKAQWFDTQERLAAAPNLGYRVVRLANDSPREVEASLSLLKPYAGSWFAHQLARQKFGDSSPPRSGRDALRDIYLRGYEPVQLDPKIKWLFAYYDAHVRWTQYAKFDFVSWHEHTGQACLLPFQLLEADATKAWASPEGVEIGTPTNQECKQLFDFLEGNRPLAYREALDLVPSRIDIAAIKEQWAASNLTRDRELLVARVNGKVLAVAVMETVHPGLNLFNVLDGVRLYPLVQDESSADVQNAYCALLGAAASWYRERNRKVFVHYAETPHRAYAEATGMADLGEGKLWIISNKLLPELIEHLCEATLAPLSLD